MNTVQSIEKVNGLHQVTPLQWQHFTGAEKKDANTMSKVDADIIMVDTDTDVNVDANTDVDMDTAKEVVVGTVGVT